MHVVCPLIWAIALISHSQLGDNELQLYGPTSIFRLAPRTPERSTPTISQEGASGSADAYRSLSQENPDLDSKLDWARHLPQGVKLTRPEHDRCVYPFHLLVAAPALLNGLVMGQAPGSSIPLFHVMVPSRYPKAVPA
jgi:hypothetical protein